MNAINKTKKISAGAKLSLLTIILLMAISSGAQNINNVNNNKKENTMPTTQKNKEVIHLLFEEALNKRNFGLLKEFVSDNYAGAHGKRGVAAFQESLELLIKGFPDTQWHIEEIICEEGKCSAKWKVSGTHKGPFNGIAPTGKSMFIEGRGSYELKDGKILNSTVLTDRLELLQQLQVLPKELSTISVSKENKESVFFIDKFFIPIAAKDEFFERMFINRAFIKTLPGFIKDEVYEHPDGDGNIICITVAEWENKKALADAKEAVAAEYKRQGFNPSELMQRLNITMDRGVYSRLP
jgi:predicted ester cyclase/heme-degrading monooxygenase HmoA